VTPALASSCHDADSLGLSRQRCEGKARCSLWQGPPTYALTADPCPGSPKVRQQCEGPESSPAGGQVRSSEEPGRWLLTAVAAGVCACSLCLVPCPAPLQSVSVKFACTDGGKATTTEITPGEAAGEAAEADAVDRVAKARPMWAGPAVVAKGGMTASQAFGKDGAVGERRASKTATVALGGGGAAGAEGECKPGSEQSVSVSFAALPSLEDLAAAAGCATVRAVQCSSAVSCATLQRSLLPLTPALCPLTHCPLTAHCRVAHAVSLTLHSLRSLHHCTAHYTHCAHCTTAMHTTLTARSLAARPRRLCRCSASCCRRRLRPRTRPVCRLWER
jgi:hypothetical protein